MAYRSATELSPQVLEAIKIYLRANGLYAKDLAERLDITPASVSDWFQGRTKSIRPEVWIRLEPLIAEYLVTAGEIRDDPAHYGGVQLLRGIPLNMPGIFDGDPAAWAAAHPTDDPELTLLHPDQPGEFLAFIADDRTAGADLRPGDFIIVRADAPVQTGQLALVVFAARALVVFAARALVKRYRGEIDQDSLFDIPGQSDSGTLEPTGSWAYIAPVAEIRRIS